MSKTEEKECVLGQDCGCKFEENGKCTHTKPCVHVDCCSWEEKSKDESKK